MQRPGMEDAETIFVHLFSDAPTDFFFMSFFLPNSEECFGRQSHSILEIQKKNTFSHCITEIRDGANDWSKMGILSKNDCFNSLHHFVKRSQNESEGKRLILSHFTKHLKNIVDATASNWKLKIWTLRCYLVRFFKF